MFICHYNLTRAASSQHDMDSTTALCPYPLWLDRMLRISSGFPQDFLKYCYPFVCILLSTQCVGAIIG